jgi:hypothetical protein
MTGYDRILRLVSLEPVVGTDVDRQRKFFQDLLDIRKEYK